MTTNDNIKKGKNKMTRFEETLSNYVYLIQRINNDYYAKHLKNLAFPSIEIKKGRRFMKIVSKSDNSESVHSFVEIETGNVYKAASYKQPELNHVRANIYNYDSLVIGVNMHGANYIR